MAKVTYYRKDFLTGYEIDTKSDGAEVQIKNLEDAGYTTNFGSSATDTFTSTARCNSCSYSSGLSFL